MSNEIVMEPPRTPPTGKSQPIESLANLEAPLDDAQVRQAIANAEANNQDPHTIRLDELAQGPVNTPPVAVSAPVEVPEKFKKSDGTVDVDKIQASTRQLDEAIQKKEEAVNKTVDDYMREYNEKQTNFRNLPNPERLAALRPAAPPPVQISQNEPIVEDFEAIVRRDYANDPLATVTKLFDLMVQKKFQPLEEKEKIEATRSNIQKLAEKDSRILREDVFAKVNEKLNSDPDLWKLKNPHKAAWLEVKEEMRLGEPSPVQAQPSRSFSPVLGGGSPPSVPSSSVPSREGNLANINTLDLRDKKQEALGDEAIRRALMGN